MNQTPKIKFQIKKFTAAALKSNLVFNLVSEDNKLAASAPQSELEHWLKKKHDFLKKEAFFSGASNKSYILRQTEFGGSTLVLVGIGKEESFDLEMVRQAAAEIYKITASEKVFDVVVDLRAVEAFELSEEAIGQAFAEGITLASYNFDELKIKKDAKKVKDFTFTILSQTASKALSEGIKKGEITGQCTNFAKRLGDMPANFMTPTILSQETSAAARGSNLKVTVWNKAKIQKERMGSFLGVALGSIEEPKFIVMEYKGAAASKRPICYVGKGLTFDCGGISIKPAAGMEEMKYDMCGGAAVIATMLTISRLKLKVNAIAYVPTTENLIGPAAMKPGDVRVARNGISIEVNNTDAEVRLILADALVYASEQKPQWIADAATLTGAMVVALGNIHTGYYTRSADFALRVEQAAQVSGELVWRMPVTDQHGEDMKGTYADLSNMSSSRGAGSATATAFLENFVEKSIPYAHFDIAGTAWNAGNRRNYNPKKGATGSIVRTFVQMAVDASK